MIPEQPTRLAVAADLSLEALLAVPDTPSAGVVICHPHPLYGGDMDNPVVVRVQEVCAGLGLATLRFNFRGVGASGGAHAGGVGEQDDARAALEALGRATGGAPTAIAGYSFGARIAALAACGDPRIGGLALIAPPLGMYDFACVEGVRAPTLMVAGTSDSYCPAPDFARLGVRLPSATAVSIEGADHFFFGKLFPLGEAVAKWARGLRRECPGS
jgi:alpha/beta superfamily hydrolase